MKVKDSISSYLIKNGVSALEINAYLEELSEHLKEKMVPILQEYGIKLINFYVNDINIPEDDPAVVQLKNALAKKAEMDIVGYNYTQERSFDTLEGAATNPGSMQSGFMGAGVGLGMGVGLGGMFGNQFGNVSQTLNTKVTKSCPNCSTMVDVQQRFCPNCGFDNMQKKETTDSKLVKCSSCGTDFAENAKFCPECGNPYNPCPFCGADLQDGTDQCEVCGKMMPKPCPKCNSPIADGNAKFCPECGESLIKKCGSCGTKIDGSPKFCPECGNKL